jgi:DNA-binding ferritin-like protein
MPNHNTNAALVHSLNGLLADLFTLYVKTKNFHWHVKGPNFHDLHLLFDAQATEIFTLTDIVAERVRKNDGKTLTGIAAIASASRLADEPRDDLPARSKPPPLPLATMPPKASPMIGPIKRKPACGSSRACWAETLK